MTGEFIITRCLTCDSEINVKSKFPVVLCEDCKQAMKNIKEYFKPSEEKSKELEHLMRGEWSDGWNSMGFHYTEKLIDRLRNTYGWNDSDIGALIFSMGMSCYVRNDDVKGYCQPG